MRNSRLDWKRGRFDVDRFETNEINGAIRGFQSTTVYDEIQYYRFVERLSQVHDIYDEGDGAGKVYRLPVTVPVLHANHDEGSNEDTDTGFYFNDDLYVTASFDQLFRTGLVFQDIRTNKYLKDRIVYDTRVFRVTDMHILGQVRERDIIVGIQATAVKPDELVNDPQFADFITESPYSDGDLL